MNLHLDHCNYYWLQLVFQHLYSVSVYMNSVKATWSSFVLNVFGWRTGKLSLTGEVSRTWRLIARVIPSLEEISSRCNNSALDAVSPSPPYPTPHPPFLHSISFIYLFREHLVSWRLNFIDWPSTWSVPTNVRPLTDCFPVLLFSSYLLILYRLSLFSPVKRLTFIKDPILCNLVTKFCSFYYSKLVSLFLLPIEVN